MANIFGIANTANVLTTNIATSLGLDGWQLKDGKYNGCTFVAFVPPILQNSALFQSGIDVLSQLSEEDRNGVYAQVNQTTGTNLTGQDPNALGQLYNTRMGLVQFTDKLITGTVVKQTPYNNSVNIEDTGFKGYQFSMTLLFLGSDYMKAIANFENAIKNPPTNPKQYLVLEHPIRGVIAGYTYILGDLEITHSLSLWRGATVNVTFRAVDTPKQTKTPTLSTAQQVLRGINTALNAVASLGGAVASIGGSISNLQNGMLAPSPLLTTTPILKVTNGRQTLTTTQYSNINQAVTNLATILFNCLAYVYQKGNPNVDVVQLDKATIDYSYLPTALNQSTAYTLNQGGIIMQYYLEQCQQVIALIDSYGILGDSNDMRVQINTSISKLGNVCESIGNKVTYNTFITPYTMSIRRVMSINNISLTQLSEVMNINPLILTGNYIPANTLVNIL